MQRKSACIFPIFILFLVFLLPCALCESPQEVVIDEDAVTIDLAVSNTYTLTARVLPEESDQSVNWYSSRNSTLSVKDGVLTAHRTGQITITANIPGNGKIKDQCTVTIIDSRIPTAVRVTSEYDTLEPTQSMQLTSHVEPALASQEVEWRSYDTSIAAVDQNGVVTAKREGTVYIRVLSKAAKDVEAVFKLTVRYAKAPEKISVPENQMELYTGSSVRIIPSFEPEDASRIITCTSSNPEIACVSNEGEITALSYGETVITVRSSANPDASAKISLRVRDERIPDMLVAHPSFLNLEPSNIRDISLLILPEIARCDLVWSSNNEDVASVDQNGRVTALSEGECTITCRSPYTNLVMTRIPVTVKYGKEIESLTLSVNEITIPRGKTASVIIEKTPTGAGNAIACTYSNPGICEMDETGVITALRRGETVVCIYSYQNPEIRKEIKVIVEDDLSPLSGSSSTTLKPVLNPGESIRPEITFEPEEAVQSYVWTCSNPEIASVDDSGVITAVSPGVCRISAVNSHASEISVDFYVTVQAQEYTLVMPERRTDKSALEDNMQKIEFVRLSAQKMLLKDYEDGKMGPKEYKRRSEIIDSAFEMYAFPWMVENVQKYWLDTNSENGLKDFKPGIMYYGLPYISGGNSDRTYNVRRAIEQDRYLPASDGDYYIFNRNHPLYDGMYVGSDCSSFISLAYFGNAVHEGEIIKTYTLYYDNRFITTDDPENMLAGDIMIRHSIHVIMFLYWADEAHTQAVFIEQGGNEPGINTISASVYTVSDYFNNYYHVRSPYDR